MPGKFVVTDNFVYVFCVLTTAIDIVGEAMVDVFETTKTVRFDLDNV